MLPSNLLTQDATLLFDQPDNGYNVLPQSRDSEVVRAYFKPRRSDTIVNGGQVLTNEYSLLFNYHTNVDGLTGVEVDGDLFTIEGSPMVHWNPTSMSIEYLRVDVRRSGV